MKKSPLYTTIIAAIAFILLGSTSIDAIWKKPAHFPNTVYPIAKNTLQQPVINLGRVLFYDPILSADTLVSCASCHNVYNAFAHSDHALSHGVNNAIGKRNAPALFNLAWQTSFMWDGAITHLNKQALTPIEHPAEMGSSMANTIAKLQQTTLYKQLFARAYGNSSITADKILTALTQFQLTHVSATSKYDAVQQHQAQFTEQEQIGYTLFKQYCNSCHREPLFSTYGFASNQLPIDTALNDVGRYQITGNRSDSLLFKIPSLRNLSYSYPYMHDGRFTHLRKVLRHYAQLQKPLQLNGKNLNPIVLNDKDQTDLTAFLLTLNDSSFVFNTQYQYPKAIIASAQTGLQ